jgi:N-acetyl sugar amidotransferase
MLDSQYQQCVRCVMDTSDSGIVFNNDGTCNHCSDYTLRINPLFDDPKKNEEKVRNLLDHIKSKGNGKAYDSIIGISGGVDSCYTAYYAKINGLNPLLVHLDNGWNTELAVQNIQTIAVKLELDLETVVLDWSEFREIQLAFLKSSIVDIEIPTDLAIPAALHQIAEKYGIKTILSGGNYSSEGILPLQWGYHVMKDMKLYRYIVRKFSKIKRKKTPGFGLWDEFYYKMIKGVKTYYPLNFINYNKDEARLILEKEIGGQFPDRKHHESRYTSFWQSYIMPVKYGFDYRLATFSTQICSNQITRDEALEQLEALPYNPETIEKEKNFICKKLQISVEEFDSLLKQKPFTYKDFPNSKKRINFVYNVYRFLFPKK